MSRSASEYLVTIREYGEEWERERTHKTIAVSAKQAVNNVSHRNGLHLSFNRRFYDNGSTLFKVVRVECVDTEQVWGD